MLTPFDELITYVMSKRMYLEVETVFKFKVHEDLLGIWPRITLSMILVFLSIEVGCEDQPFEIQRSSHPPFCGERSVKEQACLRPWLPFLHQIHVGAQWTLSHPQEISFKVGYAHDLDAEEPDHWYSTSSLDFSELGWIKVFVSAEAYTSPTHAQIFCEAVTHTHIYEVISAYDPRAEDKASLAISMDDDRLISWGTEIVNITYGEEVSPLFQTPERALGPPQGGAFDVVSLGRGGKLTFIFDPPIANGPGPDFTIFENSFSDYFLELARVDVSTDGETFFPLPHAYLGEDRIGAFGEHDASLSFGLAGKYRAGYGVPFDLSTLAWHVEAQRGTLNLGEIRFVRIVDIVGDGMTQDSFAHPIYDPYPTEASAGFDLDGIGIINNAETTPCLH